MVVFRNWALFLFFLYVAIGHLCMAIWSIIYLWNRPVFDTSGRPFFQGLYEDLKWQTTQQLSWQIIWPKMIRKTFFSPKS